MYKNNVFGKKAREYFDSITLGVCLGCIDILFYINYSIIYSITDTDIKGQLLVDSRLFVRRVNIIYTGNHYVYKVLNFPDENCFA